MTEESSEKKEKRSFKGFLRLIKSAIRGEEQDYTVLDLRTAVILLAIPMILELCMESVFAVTDIYFVNRLGEHATSVVGLTESVITFIYSVGIGLSAAATALVARRIGEKKPEEASRAGAQSIVIALLISVLLAIPGVYFAEDILVLMKAQPEAIKSCAGYTRLMFGGNVVIILIFLINGIFRGAGNAAIAMKSLWIGNIFNIILDPILIFGLGPIPALGIEGAAYATVLGRSIGVLYQCYHLYIASGVLQLRASYFRPNPTLWKKIVDVAWPATFQFLIASASWIFLAAMVADYGSPASAGYQTAIRLVIFFILPAWGMSNAAATLVGQNLGAGRPDRAEQSVNLTARFNVIFMASVTLIFLFFAKPLVGFFIPDESGEQARIAILSLRIISAGYVFYGMGMVVTQAFNGAGDTRTPTRVHLIGFWLFQIPLAYVLHNYTSIGVSGVVMAIPIAETFMAISILLIFRKGNWKSIKV